MKAPSFLSLVRMSEMSESQMQISIWIWITCQKQEADWNGNLIQSILRTDCKTQITAAPPGWSIWLYGLLRERWWHYHVATLCKTFFLYHSPEFSGVLLLKLLIPFVSSFHIIFRTSTGLLYFAHFLISCPWVISHRFINILPELLPTGISTDFCLKIDAAIWPHVSILIHLFLLRYNPSMS